MEIDHILRRGEQVIEVAQISKASLILLWVSAPAFVLVTFLVTFLPGILVRAALGWLSSFLIGVGVFLIVVLALVWSGCALVLTRRNSSYALVCTDFRVIGKTKDRELSIPYAELKNVMLGSSVWGRWLGYGDLTLHADKGSITVKNIAHAEDFRKFLMGKIYDEMGKPYDARTY